MGYWYVGKTSSGQVWECWLEEEWVEYAADLFEIGYSWRDVRKELESNIFRDGLLGRARLERSVGTLREGLRLFEERKGVDSSPS